MCKLEKNKSWAQRRSAGVGENTMAENHRKPGGSMRPLDDQRTKEAVHRKKQRIG